MNMFDIFQEWEATIYRNKPHDVQHLEIKKENVSVTTTECINKKNEKCV
jgi:hypothetical protein